VRKFILFHADRQVFLFAAPGCQFLLEIAHDFPSADSLADPAADRNKINQAGAPSLLHARADADFPLKVLDGLFSSL
jgi:hypothetical protein